MHYIRLTESEPLPELSHLHPLKVVLFAEQFVDHDRQFAICEWLVAAGCIYVMINCEFPDSWHTMVDLANLAQVDFEYIPDNSIVMTTVHEQESLSDLFWFAKHSAMHPCFEIKNTLVLDLSDQDREQTLRQVFDAA